jgi:hypothetical protein
MSLLLTVLEPDARAAGRIHAPGAPARSVVVTPGNRARALRVHAYAHLGV